MKRITFQGAANYAGEYGRSLYDLNGQGDFHRLEEIASSRGMVCWAKSLLKQSPDSMLLKADRDGMLTPANIFACSEANDPLASYIVQHVRRSIGMSVVNLLSVTNSEAIVFGGQLAGIKGFLPALTDFIDENCAMPTGKSPNYIGSGRLELQKEGMIGAAWLTWENDPAQPGEPG